ncbi:hypothetical protein JRO89_XS14G0035700 [Xanthoceras sorbifolium]|uniref:Thioredoxin domain-containing protein n=1 Tax=Xanthoceras sorbifolium TaxID=99658 RepID=A0ABQ8H3L1_9ROSI|nr:hypothetical protein JRO89_XS14G0035700 [Xanthoceras sorbifolium]
MAATRALILLLLTSASLLFSLYKFTHLSDHHHLVHRPSPTTSHQPFQDFIEALTNFKFPSTFMAIPLPFNSDDNVVSYDIDDNQLWPVIVGNDVVVLTEKNFTEFVDKNRCVMVMFYAPCCYRSMIQTQAPEFAGAAKLLKGEAVFAMVDASAERGLTMKYRIPAYPTIHFFVDGVKKFLYDVTNVMKSDAMAAWVKRKMTIGIYNITTMKEAVRIRISESKLVLGFLDSLEDSDSEELAAASKLQSDVVFYRTASADVAQLFFIDPQIKRPALIFMLPGKYYRFDCQFTRFAIADFVSTRKDPSVITFTYKDYKSIFENPLKQLWLFTSKNCSEVICTFEAAAKAFRGKLLFVQVYLENGSSLDRLAYEFGITEDAPRVVAYNSFDSKKHVFNSELTLNNIKSFAEDFLKDELTSQSDPASETVLKLPSQVSCLSSTQSTHVN